MEIPIIFLLGPSGAGKTSVAYEIERAHNFLNIQIDRDDGGNDIDIQNIRKEWNLYFKDGKVNSLINKIKMLAKTAEKDGAIMSFPSDVSWPLDDAIIRKEFGISTIVLYGTKVDCKKSFRDREQKKLKTKLPASHWDDYNRISFSKFSQPDFAEYRVSTFINGQHRNITDIVNSVLKLMNSQIG